MRESKPKGSLRLKLEFALLVALTIFGLVQLVIFAWGKLAALV